MPFDSERILPFFLGNSRWPVLLHSDSLRLTKTALFSIPADESTTLITDSTRAISRIHIASRRPRYAHSHPQIKQDGDEFPLGLRGRSRDSLAPHLR
jgi:hypothetical protein